MWAGVDVTPIEIEGVPLGPSREGIDLFGDGRNCYVFTSAMAGHLSVTVDTGTGWILLAGDVGHPHRSWKEEIFPARPTTMQRPKPRSPGSASS